MRGPATPVLTMRAFSVLSHADEPMESGELARAIDVHTRRLGRVLRPLLVLGWAREERGCDGIRRYRARWWTDPGWLGAAAIVDGGRRG